MPQGYIIYIYNIPIDPPALSPVSSPTAIDEHEWNGKPQAWFLCKSAPTNPIKGATYWADGTNWNPLGLNLYNFPYPVIYQLNKYCPINAYETTWIATSTNKTLSNFDNILVNTSSAITITLPTPADGVRCTIKASNGTNNVTVNGNGQGIDWGGQNYTLAPKGCITVMYAAYYGQWVILSKA